MNTYKSFAHNVWIQNGIEEKWNILFEYTWWNAADVLWLYRVLNLHSVDIATMPNTEALSQSEDMHTIKGYVWV